MSQLSARGTTESIRSLLDGAWWATRLQRGRLFVFVSLFLFAYTLDLLSPWAIGYALGAFVEHGVSGAALDYAYWGILAYFGIRLSYNICHHLARYLQQTAAFSAKMETMERIFGTLLRFPLSWHVDHHSGESLSRLHRASGAIDATIGTYVWQLIEGLTKIVFASIAILALDRWVALNVMAMGIVTILLIVFFNQRLVRTIRASNTFFDRLNRICVDYLVNVITIKSLSLEAQAEQYLSRRRPDGQELNRRIMRLSELKWAMVGVGYTIVIGSSLYIYFQSHSNLSRAIDIAEVYVLLNYLDRIFQAIGSFTAYYSGVIESATAYEDATQILGESITLPPALHRGPLVPGWKKLELRDVTFHYPGESAEALAIQSLTIRQGEKIALVGPSGGGKSTLLKILGGLLLPRSGTAVLDGTTMVSFEALSPGTLLIPQEPEIFSESLRFNLSLGDEFSVKELDFFASLCRINGVIDKLPQGWDSFLAESGMNLSVGEKQRVALARGLLRAQHRELILLDEPTSSLDPMNEKHLFHGLLHHFADRTVLSACHRLALVPLFDRILYIRRGRIEEAGTFQELLEKRGAFYIAWLDFEDKTLAPAVRIEGSASGKGISGV